MFIRKYHKAIASKVKANHDSIACYTKTKNGIAIFSFKNPQWVWFLIHESVTTLS